MNIIDIINNKEKIKDFYDKINAFHKEIKKEESIWNKKYIGIPFYTIGSTSLLFFTYINYTILIQPEVISGTSISLFLTWFLISIVGATLISLVSVGIITYLLSFYYKRIKKEVSESKLAKQINEDSYKAAPKINQKIKKYEDNFNDFENYFFNNHIILNLKKSKFEELYFIIFRNELEKENAEDIINNKEKILEGIKTNFKLKEQKSLLKAMTKVIKENTVEEDIFNLEEAIENNLNQKNKETKNNLINNKIIQEI